MKGYCASGMANILNEVASLNNMSAQRRINLEHFHEIRLIPAVSTTAHALAHAVTPEPLAELTAAILGSLVLSESAPRWGTHPC